jgi:hypothetical protein
LCLQEEPCTVVCFMVPRIFKKKGKKEKEFLASKRFQKGSLPRAHCINRIATDGQKNKTIHI